jgi:hypothetical protein
LVDEKTPLAPTIGDLTYFQKIAQGCANEILKEKIEEE